MLRLIAVLMAVALLAGQTLLPSALSAQDTTSTEADRAMVFSLSESYLHDLATNRTIRFKARVTVDARSNVHKLASDCEMHLATHGSTDLASPPAVVVEPPNLCKRRLPGIPKTGAIGAAWQQYVDQHVLNQQCDVVGFPRIFSEHREGGGDVGSNPNHVLEIHPALSISCDNGTALDFSPLLRIYPGMRHISDASAAVCLEERKLWVRKNGSLYEFAEEGAKGPGGRCGNFIVVEATVHRAYIREFDKGTGGRGDHSAIAWVTVGGYGPYSLKIYTYRDTPEDTALTEIANGTNASRVLHVHGMITYDYLAILRAVQDSNRNWLADISTWTQVPHPLSLVVFGTSQAP